MGAAVAATPHHIGGGAARGSPDPPPGPPTAEGRRWLPRPVVRLLHAALLLGAVLVVVGLAGIELATPGGSGYSQGLDSGVATWMASHRDLLTTAVGRGLGLATALPAMLVVAVGAGVWLTRSTDRRSLGLGPVAALAVATLLARVIGLVVARPGPGTNVANGSVLGSSFPSTGAAAVVAVALATDILARRGAPRRPGGRLVAGAIAAVAVVALGSTLLVGSHWLSDVIAGAVVGSAAAIVVAGLFTPRQPRVRSRWVLARRALVLGVALAAIPAGTSYLEALSYPGQAATSVRTVDWLRNGGLGGPVDRAEAWWLWHHLPSGGTVFALQPLPSSHGPVPTDRTSAAASPATTSPTTPSPTTSPTTSRSPARPTTIDGGGQVPSRGPAVADPPPAPIAPILTAALPGEGAWTVIDPRADGGPALAATRVRPDPAHPELIATVAWMDQAALRFALVAGTREPGGGPGAWDAHVPADLQPNLVAAFNSGFRMKDTPGGALEEGHQVRTLGDGLATFAVRADGTATVGVWGRDLQAGPDIMGARQNLRLIVDGGQAVPGLALNDGRWGPLSQAAPTWRSGLGVDASGHLLYVSGNHLTLGVLADVLRRAGAVRAMELDIHSQMVVFNLFSHPAGALRPVGQKLSPDMVPSADRYLSPDQRDFVAVFAR